VYFQNRNEFVQSYYYPSPVFKTNPLKNAFWNSLGAGGNPDLIASAGVPILIIGGWFDINLEVNLRDFNILYSMAPSNNKPKILMGPWSHSHLGELTQGGRSFPAAQHADSLQALDFFEYYLRQNTTSSYPTKYQNVRYFRIDSDTFIEGPSWPPVGPVSTTYYLGADGSLSTVAPTTQSAWREYESRPLSPMLTKFGRILNETSGYGMQGCGDLSEYTTRSDTLVYTTGPLTSALTIEGNMTLSVWVSIQTVGVVDTDVHVRLLHHYPDDSKVGLVDGVRRLSLRNGYTVSEPLSPTSITGPYQLNIAMMPTAMTVPAGHSLIIMLAASNNNEFELNYQDGSKHIDDSGATPKNGTIRIWSDASHPSLINLPVVASTMAPQVSSPPQSSATPTQSPTQPGSPMAQGAAPTASANIPVAQGSPAAQKQSPVSEASKSTFFAPILLLASLALCL
jgi:putative CocE/NonD family hydrolase